MSPELGALSGQDKELRSLDSRRNHALSQNERTAQEGRGSVLKHLRDQFIWSKLPISQAEIHKSPPKSCFVNLTDGVSTCAPYIRDRVGGWTGLSQKDWETEERGRQPVQTLAISTRSQNVLEICGTPILGPEETKSSL